MGGPGATTTRHRYPWERSASRGPSASSGSQRLAPDFNARLFSCPQSPLPFPGCHRNRRPQSGAAAPRR
eukprot:10973261-Alexandrium_andersonii.AAC.1